MLLLCYLHFSTYCVTAASHKSTFASAEPQLPDLPHNFLLEAFTYHPWEMLQKWKLIVTKGCNCSFISREAGAGLCSRGWKCISASQLSPEVRGPWKELPWTRAYTQSRTRQHCSQQDSGENHKSSALQLGFCPYLYVSPVLMNNSGLYLRFHLDFRYKIRKFVSSPKMLAVNLCLQGYSIPLLLFWTIFFICSYSIFLIESFLWTKCVWSSIT